MEGWQKIYGSYALPTQFCCEAKIILNYSLLKTTRRWPFKKHQYGIFSKRYSTMKTTQKQKKTPIHVDLYFIVFPRKLCYSSILTHEPNLDLTNIWQLFYEIIKTLCT